MPQKSVKWQVLLPSAVLFVNKKSIVKALCAFCEMHGAFCTQNATSRMCVSPPPPPPVSVFETIWPESTLEISPFTGHFVPRALDSFCTGDATFGGSRCVLVLYKCWTVLPAAVYNACFANVSLLRPVQSMSFIPQVLLKIVVLWELNYFGCDTNKHACSLVKPQTWHVEMILCQCYCVSLPWLAREWLKIKPPFYCEMPKSMCKLCFLALQQLTTLHPFVLTLMLVP